MIMQKIIHLGIVLAIFFLLVYTRVVNLGWGLPYPMHPDERNMADAVMKIRCDNPEEFLRGIAVHAPKNVITYLTIGEFALEDIKIKCLNPQFFAYGQLSLMMGYGFAYGIHFLSQVVKQLPNVAQMNFSESVMGLRIWSAIVSILLPFVLLQILVKVNPIFLNRRHRYWSILLFIFSPILIQFSHYGTTEAVLMLWYAVLTYLAVVAIQKDELSYSSIILMGIVSGLAIATKASSVVYLAVPISIVVIKSISALIFRMNEIVDSVASLFVSANITNVDLKVPKEEPNYKEAMLGELIDDQKVTAKLLPLPINVISIFTIWLRFLVFVFLSIMLVTFIAGITSFIFSPHNFISLRELLGSMHYESDVGLGKYIPFYTRQFLLEYPILFQAEHIFPFALGLPMFLLAAIGLIILPFTRSYNVLRLVTISYAVLTMSWYAKWTRFIAPIYPIMIVLGILSIIHLYSKYISNRMAHKNSFMVGVIVTVICILPGAAFTSIYANDDVRFVASEWVYNNVPADSYILSETANVIDIPIPDVQNKKQIPEGYNIQYLSFNSYEVDADRQLQTDLQDAIQQADYIFVPSRRVFYNHTCVDLKGKITNARHSKEKCAYLARTYPVLKKYYEDLFSGKSGFTQVAEFSSYPRVQLFGKTILEFPDEYAEETFTVFDHPVMRIYKRN